MNMEEAVRITKGQVLINFTMAEGSFVYDNRDEATRLVREAYWLCVNTLDPVWWEGRESVLYHHFRVNCPKMHAWWLVISGEDPEESLDIRI